MTLIIALDYTHTKEAEHLIEQLSPKMCALKIGSEMFTRFGAAWVERYVKQGFRIFLDLKFHDIPNTVASAARVCADMGIWMFNVHALGGMRMMMAAKEALRDYAHPPLLIAVTLLTSLTEAEVMEVGISGSFEAEVSRLTALAYDAELDGVVCPACYVPKVKAITHTKFLTVTPGIRLSSEDWQDQKQCVTPAEAVALGTDYIVMGRSITRASSPIAIVQNVLKEIRMP